MAILPQLNSELNKQCGLRKSNFVTSGDGQYWLVVAWFLYKKLLKPYYKTFGSANSTIHKPSLVANTIHHTIEHIIVILLYLTN